MSNADIALALLRGEIDVQTYWQVSGRQRVRSAGVLLTEQQQHRSCKQLNRLATELRRTALDALFTEPIKLDDCVANHELAFDNYLASLR